MRMKFWTNLSIVSVMVVGLVGGGCDRSEGPPPGDPVVVATIVPLASVVSQLVGDGVKVETLIPASVSPHGFEPTVQQMQALGRGRGLVMVGAGYDEWAAKAARNQRHKVAVIRFDQLVGVKVEDDHGHGHDDHGHHHHAHGSVNPHLWIDPVLMRMFVEKLGGEELPRLLPDRKEQIAAATAKLVEELKTLEADIAAGLGPHVNKSVITYHNAFDPMLERYGLKVALTLVPDDAVGATLTPGRLEQARQIIRDQGLKAVYSEPQFPADFAGPLEAMGVKVLVLDPLGDPHSGDRATYQQMMRYNLARILEGF
jgi:zinc transport system substrate-binding protein